MDTTVSVEITQFSSIKKVNSCPMDSHHEPTLSTFTFRKVILRAGIEQIGFKPRSIRLSGGLRTMFSFPALPVEYSNFHRSSQLVSNALAMSNTPPGYPSPWLVPGQDYSPLSYSAIQSHNSAAPINHPPVDPKQLEQRKEKSRDAARSRRGKENSEFYELAKMLPLEAAITGQLDKASIIRLTMSYLKLKEFSEQGVPTWPRESIRSNDIFENHIGTHILHLLDGFSLATSVDGRFLYISETVTNCLGLSQIELTGSSIFDYVHKDDHAELEHHLGIKKNPDYSDYVYPEHSTPSPSKDVKPEHLSEAFQGDDRALCIRMKSTLTKRGCHFKSSGYRVILLLCRLRKRNADIDQRQSMIGSVGIGMELLPPALHEIKLESDMFTFRTGLDLAIVHCEARITSFLGYSAEELLGKSVYSLCHGQDIEKLRRSHRELIEKGQILTPFYRILHKTAGYFWIQTCYTMVCQSKSAADQTVVCVNYVISGPERDSPILDITQVPNLSAEDCDSGFRVKRSATSAAEVEINGEDHDLNGNQLCSKKPRIKAESPEHVSINEHHVQTEKKSSSGRKSSSNRASVIRMSNKTSSKKVLQESE
ncbi:hypothetical protein pipiens_006194 [Culex pipiens pipiens]|uniref:Uncharacterized protein n=2 Tax=Culex pipiens TaxID=7175 RepID=A0ABD1DRJ0_CULPP